MFTLKIANAMYNKPVKHTYKIGDIVDLNKSNLLGGKRLAEVIEIHKHFVVCRSVKGGYRECLNV